MSERESPHIPLGITRDPKAPEEKTVQVFVTRDSATWLLKTQEVIFENLKTAKRTLENVELIFGGVREFNEGGYCFVARPRQVCIQPNVWADLRAGRVFCVYVQPNFLAYNWYEEPEDSDMPGYPLGHAERYKEELWCGIP